MRVLYSFPNRLGGGRICDTAWHQVAGLHHAGAMVTVFTASLAKPVPAAIPVHTTLSVGKLRIPLRWLGRHHASRLHDHLVAAWLRRNPKAVDAVHTWPLGAINTLKAARELGIPSYLERPNTHTGYAYRISSEEERIVGLRLPSGHDHQDNPETLRREETEYAAADYLLCPSDFVKKTFLDRGFPADRLLRHQYGFEQQRWRANPEPPTRPGLVMLYAGVGEPRKGLHYALHAWLASTAAETGEFWICGSFVDGYSSILSRELSHPSIKVLGHRTDLDALMRQADLFVLSSVEEGSALVTYEARASGCVLLVSTAVGAVVSHMDNGLVHEPRDQEALAEHISLLDKDRTLLSRLRERSLSTAGELTWEAAGRRLLELYRNSGCPSEIPDPGSGNREPNCLARKPVG